MTNRGKRREKLSAEIDYRIHNLAMSLLDNDELSTDSALRYARAAYAAGYLDCANEDPEIRCKWFKELGYGVSR